MFEEGAPGSPDASGAGRSESMPGQLGFNGLSEAARHWPKVALVASLALVLTGVVVLPFVFRSMVLELGAGQERTLYNLMTGEPVKPGEDFDPSAGEYLNIAAVELDAISSAVTLAVSGNRTCPETCPAIRLTFLSLDDDVTRRRGLSPFASVSLGPADTIFSAMIALPVKGTTVRYPFDTYELWLGLASPPADASGDAAPPPRPPDGQFVATLQNQIPQLVMAPPAAIDPAQVRAQTDDLDLEIVQRLTFRRPDYLPVLTVALVLLIAASSALALATQSIDTLLLGVGGLILGIWGVRSVLVPQPLPLVTAVDLSLSAVILILLLGLAARITIHFHRESGVRLPWQR